MTKEEAIEVLENHTQYFVPVQDLAALNIAIDALYPVTRDQMRGYWIHEKIQSNQSITGYFELPCCECSNCGCYVQQETNFCPYCGDPKTDEAVQMVMERLEALNENRD